MRLPHEYFSLNVKRYTSAAVNFDGSQTIDEYTTTAVDLFQVRNEQRGFYQSCLPNLKRFDH